MGAKTGIGESHRERVEPFAPMTWHVDGKICAESLKEFESGGSSGGLKFELDDFELDDSDKRYLSLSRFGVWRETRSLRKHQLSMPTPPSVQVVVRRGCEFRIIN